MQNCNQSRIFHFQLSFSSLSLHKKLSWWFLLTVFWLIKWRALQSCLLFLWSKPKLGRILCALRKSNCSTQYFKSILYYKVIKMQKRKLLSTLSLLLTCFLGEYLKLFTLAFINILSNFLYSYISNVTRLASTTKS